MQDPEIEAMGVVGAALDPLDRDARQRVLTWAAQRFNDGLIATGSAATSRVPTVAVPDSAELEFSDFVDLFDAVNPVSDKQKALVGGYWFQEVLGMGAWDSQRVNTALKDVGHGIGNITRALDQLQMGKPALVRQISKSGKSKQARKAYKLTTSGTAEVRSRLAGEI